MYRLNYVHKHRYTKELVGRLYMVEMVRESPIYQSLFEQEIALLINYTQLYFIVTEGIWAERC